MEVKDSGSGMSESTKAKMFEPFFTTKLTGRGLGLAAVSGIVRGHRGTMHIDSTPGQGTTFTVSFPAVPAGVLRCLDSASLVIPNGNSTILIVDDEAAIRKMAGAILKKFGYSILIAKDGLEAVEIFRENASKIGAVLLDMSMPVMSGYKALRLINDIQPGVPIIVSSGYSEIFAREELGPDVVAWFLQKPYAAAHLVEIIQKALPDFHRA
jgi:CheY-like chemotaxis protein